MGSQKYNIGGAFTSSSKTAIRRKKERKKRFWENKFDCFLTSGFLLSFLQAFIAGAAAPQSKWEDDAVMLRSAAISLSVL